MRIFNVALPANGSVVTLESEPQEGYTSTTAQPPTQSGLPTTATTTETTPSFGGQVYVKNTGTVPALIGGNDQNCTYPLAPTDPSLGPLHLGSNDILTAKIASGSTAGQITVIEAAK